MPMNGPTRRARRLAIALSLGLAAALTVSASGAFAQRLEHRGSADDQRFCTPDVFRLCASEIPSEPRIVACLIRSKRSLSPGCRAVFDRDEKRPTRSAKAKKRPERVAAKTRSASKKQSLAR